MTGFHPGVGLAENILGELSQHGNGRPGKAARFDPPSWPALQATAKQSKQRSKMLEDLAKCDARLVGIAPQKYMSAEAVASLKETVRQLGQGRRFKLAEVRDALKLSRRVVQTMLEYLDRVQFTRRVGDERELL